MVEKLERGKLSLFYDKCFKKSWLIDRKTSAAIFGNIDSIKQ